MFYPHVLQSRNTTDTFIPISGQIKLTTACVSISLNRYLFLYLQPPDISLAIHKNLYKSAYTLIFRASPICRKNLKICFAFFFLLIFSTPSPIDL